mgnify:CR=1 FL=1
MHSLLPVLSVFSRILLAFCPAWLVPLGWAWFLDGHLHAAVWAVGFCLNLASGLLLWHFTRRHRRELQARDGFLLVNLVWLVLPAYAAAPLYFTVPDLSLSKAFAVGIADHRLRFRWDVFNATNTPKFDVGQLTNTPDTPGFGRYNGTLATCDAQAGDGGQVDDRPRQGVTCRGIKIGAACQHPRRTGLQEADRFGQRGGAGIAHASLDCLYAKRMARAGGGCQQACHHGRGEAIWAMAKRPDYQLEDQIGFVLRRVTQRHLALFSAAIPQVTTTQWAVIARLSELGPMSQNHLGREAAMAGPR